MGLEGKATGSVSGRSQGPRPVVGRGAAHESAAQLPPFSHSRFQCRRRETVLQAEGDGAAARVTCPRRQAKGGESTRRGISLSGMRSNGSPLNLLGPPLISSLVTGR